MKWWEWRRHGDYTTFISGTSSGPSDSAGILSHSLHCALLIAGLPRREQGETDDGIIDYSCILSEGEKALVSVSSNK